MKKPLVVYYSFSGSTKALAEEIARQTGADIWELIPKKPYDFSYNTASKEARNEIARGYCPELLGGLGPIDQYDVIFIGSPNWFKSIAPPVLSFLKQHDFSKKTVVSFCTHGGVGFGDIERRIAEECVGANLHTGLSVAGEPDKERVSKWLKSIGFAAKEGASRAGN